MHQDDTLLGVDALTGLATPVLVLLESALSFNVERMARYCTEHGVELAPHVKTTMSPEIARRQLDAGAWAVTVANPAQAAALADVGRVAWWWPTRWSTAPASTCCRTSPATSR